MKPTKNTKIKFAFSVVFLLFCSPALSNTCNYEKECFTVTSKEEVKHEEKFFEEGTIKKYKYKDFDFSQKVKGRSDNCMNYKQWDNYYNENSNGFVSIGGSLFDSAGVRWDRCGDPDKENRSKNFDFKKFAFLTEIHWIKEISKSWVELIEKTQTICKIKIGGITPVPEPGSFILFIVGIIGLIAVTFFKLRK